MADKSQGHLRAPKSPKARHPSGIGAIGTTDKPTGWQGGLVCIIGKVHGAP
jgi:hypothetical protein